jgi:hypothetical protein
MEDEKILLEMLTFHGHKCWASTVEQNHSMPS